jgi:hypothetical protein
MLDISIKDLKKTITSASKAKIFFDGHLKIVEKIDGTKLTLIRNCEVFDPIDYTKNWIVSYKDNIIHATEFCGLAERDSEIREFSIGTSQYKFVHDHLRKVHPDCAEIPRNTEFFVEFVQNKPTITRDYVLKHNMFLVGFGDCNFVQFRGRLYSSSMFHDDAQRFEKYRQLLQLGEFPTLFKGRMNAPEAIEFGSAVGSVRELLISAFRHVDFDRHEEVMKRLIGVFEDFQSVLGGQSEGVVIERTGDDGKSLSKVLAPDQHLKEVRDAKKSRFKATERDEETYWEAIHKVAAEMTKDVVISDLQETFGELSSRIYRTKTLPAHSIKTLLSVQDDVFLTAKLNLLGPDKSDNVALIPMAAKPFHAGHASLIDRAFSDGCKSVMLFLSTKDRSNVSTHDMLTLWRDVYFPKMEIMYGSGLYASFSGSPMTEALLFAKRFLTGASGSVSIYGGSTGDGDDDAKSRLESFLTRLPQFKERLSHVSISRTLTNGLCASDMRDYLSSGESRIFKENLPSWLSEDNKDTIWNTLRI